MLVLSRKVNEQILIGEAIKITILRVRGDAIRIGIEAPREVQVRRSELPPRPQADAAPKLQRPRPRRHGEQNPGEKKGGRPLCIDQAGPEVRLTPKKGSDPFFGNQPLAAKLPARRVPSAPTSSLMT
jgi:carbon storage regulator CsrA